MLRKNEHCYREIDIEIDKEKDIDKDIDIEIEIDKENGCSKKLAHTNY